MSSSDHDQVQHQGELDLQQVRRDIDKLDQTILHAIEARAALAANVSAAKSGRHTFRPGREADLISNLIRQSSLPPVLVEKIWRSIIAHNLTSQGGLVIACLDHDDITAAAAFRFGTNYDAHLFDAAGDVVTAVAMGDAQLGIVPDWSLDDSWLDRLAAYRRDGGDVYIAAQTHMLASHNLAQSAVLSSILPDPSVHDITLTIGAAGIETHDGYHPDTPGIVGIIQKCDIS